MTATTVNATAQTRATARATTRTGGPKEDGPKVLEHILGWTLVVVLAMLVTQTGLM
ncbi:SCO1431 family membrane protein [Streptomyces sp. NPDC048441]|uniref:SCO1431 family membrane protein n=1 Tax=Streptomyces sp. NPDC048441 TaxID=3365552 RepID=UPI00371C354C